MSVIEVRGLTRDYGGGRGVFDLTFGVERGEVFGFLGPNGAGKTTTIRHLLGFLHPRAGHCAIAGMDCARQSADIQRRLGYLPGEIAFPDGMNGVELLRFVARLKGVDGLGRGPELMERFQLDPKGKVRRMSKGMKQKLGLVCAFLSDPDILILDEPTSGLDPLMQNAFVELIREERDRGKTILMSSHMFDEVERTCGRAAILKRGRLAAVEEMDTLRSTRENRYLVSFSGPEAAAAFAAEVGGAEAEGCRVTVNVRGELAPFLAALARHPVTGLDVRHQTLEELFLRYYGGEAG